MIRRIRDILRFPVNEVHMDDQPAEWGTFSCENSTGVGDSGASDGTGGSDSAVLEDVPKITEPPKYAVFIINDNYSTFDFVVEVLMRFFSKSEDEAQVLTLKIHHEGKGHAGSYSLEIAETKVMQVHQFAKERGYPLRAKLEQI